MPEEDIGAVSVEGGVEIHPVNSVVCMNLKRLWCLEVRDTKVLTP
jgi:hypothetical protein